MAISLTPFDLCRGVNAYNTSIFDESEINKVINSVFIVNDLKMKFDLEKLYKVIYVLSNDIVDKINKLSNSNIVLENHLFRISNINADGIGQKPINFFTGGNAQEYSYIPFKGHHLKDLRYSVSSIINSANSRNDFLLKTIHLKQ